MANTPVLTDEQWDALRAASMRGVADPQLSEAFGVAEETIRTKRFRDEIWKAAVNANRELVNGAIKDKETRIETKGVETASLAQKVASTISENAESLSSSNLLLASQIAQKGLRRASSEIDHLPLENIADIERIFKMAALAGKWSQPQVNVQQAFAFGGGQADDSILECETVIVEDAGNYGDSFKLDLNEGES